MKKRRTILITLISILTAYLLFNYLNVGGYIIPIHMSKSTIHPENKEQQIIDFKVFNLVTPLGWQDKGFKVGDEGEWYGYIKNGKTKFLYEYGITASPAVMTLKEYLFWSRNSLSIMGQEVIESETDSTITVSYKRLFDPDKTDTIKTGKLTDSLLRIHPIPPQVFERDCNYYSITQYQDTSYFIHIKVPDYIINSDINNLNQDGFTYNVVRSKTEKSGFTKVTVNSPDFFTFSLRGENLNSIMQEELITIGMSLKFNEEERIAKPNNGL
ncbi:hypothetical protein KEM09_09525 [Carboxylicivirga mesophila]|uniref:DUF3108 domain-containing protein n=1 Tax=Carboxylicivirga mesophila TaxID=1166478 RepID=A0ABS5K9W9_9BACT|nr:hypothetical protein [Carboxylicivirga mesophila]MBS2211642.1 hypothetical protein [Carboxylicivirga mesophila]